MMLCCGDTAGAGEALSFLVGVHRRDGDAASTGEPAGSMCSRGGRNEPPITGAYAAASRYHEFAGRHTMPRMLRLPGRGHGVARLSYYAEPMIFPDESPASARCFDDMPMPKVALI